MKKIYLLLLLFPVVGFSQSNFQVGTYFGTYSPFKSQMPKMSTTYGQGFHFAYKPSAHLPISLDWSSHFGWYYNRTMKETYVFSNGSSTTTDVTYTSKLRNHLFGVKVNLSNDYSAFRPYIKPQLGWATMKSKIWIADPNDVDDCQPLDKETNHVYRGAVYGGEAGFEIDMNRLFKNVMEENKHFLYFSVAYLRGFGQFEYINQKYMMSHEHGVHEGGSTETEDGRDLTTQFINVTTQEIHDHKIAEVYKTPYEMWGLKIGYVINF
jgi:hypothetical protein